MKKLLALLLILTLFLSGCEYIGLPGVTTPPTDTGDTQDPPSDEPTDKPTDEPTDEPTEEPTDEPTDEPTECLTHTDTDDNGTCDVCAVNVLVWYDLYAINDLHGKITDGDYQPGVEELTTYLKNITETRDNVIILSSGDMWQGSSESNLTYGMIVTEWMNEIGTVSMTLGNHEFDWSDEYIYENLEIANFPFLAINIYDKNTGEQMDYCESSIIIDKGGFRIGIIGAIGDCYTSISGEVVGDVYFKVGDELTELVKAESEKLRDEGADFIIYSLHDGGTGSSSLGAYYDTELSNGYVDIVFEGHSHQSYTFTDSLGVKHIQGGGENDGISYARVSINSANGNSRVATARVIGSGTYAKSEPDGIIDELLEKYADMIAPAYEVLGYNKYYRDDSDIEQLVADLYYKAGVERWGDEYDIALGGGFIRTRNPYNLYAGEVYYSDIYSLLPFDNEIVLCSISGKDLYDKFINTSNSDYYICCDSALGNIDPSKTYYVVTDTYTSTYTWNNLTEVARYTPGVYARDLVAEYVKTGAWEK